MTKSLHKTVLLLEAVEALKIQPNAWYVDATFGRGGHSQEILHQGGNVIAFDFDKEAIEFGQENFAESIAQGKLILIRENFDQVTAQIKGLGHTIQGFLFDFGTSTEQLTSLERGFSFESDQALDMRMDQRLGVTAEDLIKVLPEAQLIQLFQEYGGERESKVVTKAIKHWLSQNSGQPLTGSTLAQVVSRAKHEPRTKLHPATKVFQALRIAVNQELDSIHTALNQLEALAQPQTRVVTIAFHEGEDRIVKTVFTKWEKQAKGRRINKDVIIPSPEELAANPRARSAKMRVFEYV
jgi:16S rRNA (cytosine1402-N4)-methyltransferase